MIEAAVVTILAGAGLSLLWYSIGFLHGYSDGMNRRVKQETINGRHD